jgi:MFS family permease
MEKHSRQKIVFWSVLLQAVMWIALVFLGAGFFLFNLSSKQASALLVIIYTLLIVFGAFAGPAWSSWMKDLITKNKGTYFGRRSMIAGLLALIFMFIAGFILDYFRGTRIFVAFVILFSLAFLGRFISAALFLKQYEPKLKLNEGYYFSFRQFLKKLPFNNFGRFTIFMGLINFSTAIASPFFAVYLLEDLRLKSIQSGYIFYTIIIMASSVTTLIFMTWWGRFADKYGNYKVMKATGYFVPLIPAFWLISYFMLGNISIFYIVIFLLFGEAISGVIWGGFNLSAGNYIYDAVTRERMALCVSYMGVINGAGVFLGAILGGIIASIDFVFLGFPTLFWVFIISLVARFIIIRIMIPKIREVRENLIQGDLKKEIECELKRAIRKDEKVLGKSIKKFHLSNFLSAIQNKLVKPRPSEMS